MARLKSLILWCWGVVVRFWRIISRPSAWLIMFGGLSCWLVYFVSKGDLVGTVANISGVAGAGVTLACIWHWGRKRPDAAADGARSRVGEVFTTDQG